MILFYFNQSVSLLFIHIPGLPFSLGFFFPPSLFGLDHLESKDWHVFLFVFFFIK